MIFTHNTKTLHENDFGDPYYVFHEDSLRVELDRGRVCFAMHHSGNYSVSTSISLSKEEVVSLRNELDRIVKKM